MLIFIFILLIKFGLLKIYWNCGWISKDLKLVLNLLLTGLQFEVFITPQTGLNKHT